ncbi:MAG: GyrI-like domain-containing protein, partial [Salibacteraceae bacterium]
YDSGELPFMMRPMGKMMDAMIGPDFENGLASLKAHVEEHASMTKVDFGIEEVVIEPLSYLSITDSCVVAEIGTKSKEMFTKLGAYCGQNNISISGSPFTFYHTWDGKSTVMEACFPTDEPADGSEEISAKTMMAGNALKLVYKGDYADSEEAHMAMGEFAETNGKEIIGSPWEVYLVGPMDTEDVNAFVTEIYYPIK